MPNCTHAAADAARKHASLLSRLKVDLATIQSAEYRAFYYTNSFYQKGHASLFKLEPATKAALAMLLGFVGLALWEARQGCGHGARAAGKVAPAGAASSRARLARGLTLSACQTHAFLLLAAVGYVDMLSGLLHIVLDNPKFVTLPLLGPGAVGFQRHHHHPAGVTVHNIANFVQEHIGGMCAVLAAGLVPARWSAGARTNLLRVFLAEVRVLSPASPLHLPASPIISPCLP